MIWVGILSANVVPASASNIEQLSTLLEDLGWRRSKPTVSISPCAPLLGVADITQSSLALVRFAAVGRTLCTMLRAPSLRHHEKPWFRIGLRHHVTPLVPDMSPPSTRRPGPPLVERTRMSTLLFLVVSRGVGVANSDLPRMTWPGAVGD